MNDFTTLPIDSRLLDEHDAKKELQEKPYPLFLSMVLSILILVVQL